MPGARVPAGVNSAGLVVANTLHPRPDKDGPALDASYLASGQWQRLPVASNDPYQQAHALLVNDNAVMAGNGGFADGEFPALWICT